MVATKITQDGQTFEIPAGVLIDSNGPDSARCADCGGWSHLEGSSRIRHSSRCATPELQVSWLPRREASAAVPARAEAPDPVEECNECGATYRTAGNVWDSGMCCRRCK